MARVSPAMSYCNLARAVGLLGDWWTLLILRDVVLIQNRRFDELHRSLGIATNVLTKRLNDLVEAGIIERIPTTHPRSSHEYRSTEKGNDLWPILISLLDWGNRWEADDESPPRRILHRGCGTPVDTARPCPECGEPLSPASMQFEPMPVPFA